MISRERQLDHDARTTLERVVEPAAEPVHLDQAKLHVRQTDTADDSLIPVYVAAVRATIEEWCGFSLACQTLELGLEAWPLGGAIELPRPPLVSVESVSYTLEDGTTSTLSSASYVVDRRSARLVLKDGEIWPSDELQVGTPIVVRYVTGFMAPATADASADTLTASGRTFAAGDTVQLLNSGGALPGGLAERTTYYVVNPTGSTLQLSATSGGAAINITSAGTGTHWIGRLRMPDPALQAIRLLLGHWYENREAVIDTGRKTLLPVPLAVESLVLLAQRWSFG